MKRKDFRTLDQFKNDIKFSTKLESFWIDLYCKTLSIQGKTIYITNTGTNNDGELTEKASNAADYKIKIDEEELSIEVKWSPTPGKSTFKVNNLTSYIKNDANILLIYNIGTTSLKKPKNYQLNKHIELIETNLENIRYGIISTKNIEKILNTYPHEKCYYMGGKLSVIVPQQDYSKYLDKEQQFEF